MGIGVFAWTAYHVVVLGVPRAEVMGVIGFMALGANLLSVLLLARYKDGDANVRSVWLCSRNDAIGNVAVMIAALGVWSYCFVFFAATFFFTVTFFAGTWSRTSPHQIASRCVSSRFSCALTTAAEIISGITQNTCADAAFAVRIRPATASAAVRSFVMSSSSPGVMGTVSQRHSTAGRGGGFRSSLLRLPRPRNP